MKKYTYILFAAAAILAAMSCNKEINPEIEITPVDNATDEQTLANPITLTFTATAGSATKVSLDGEGTSGTKKTAKWEAGDQIKIVWYNSLESKMNSAISDELESGGSATASFHAIVEAAEYYYAVYPSTLSVTLDGSGSLIVSFPNDQNASEVFGGAAWYAAKTSMNSKSFAFHPISTVIKFKLNGNRVSDPNEVYFRSISGLGLVRGDAVVTFEDGENYPLSIAPLNVQKSEGWVSQNGAGAVTVKVSGVTTGTEKVFYFPIPAYGCFVEGGYEYYNNNTHSQMYSLGTTAGVGFILWAKNSSTSNPAAYYGGTITQAPGKLYNISTPVDNKIVDKYYVASEDKSTADGSSEDKAGTLATLKEKVPAFKYSSNIGASLLLNGTTIYMLGGEYNVPIGVFNTNSAGSKFSYKIVGGYDSNVTTITTTSSSTYNNSQATVSLENITFSGCSTQSAMTASAGEISLKNVKFLNNNSAGAQINGGALSISGSAQVSIESSLFNGNKAGKGLGGAIYFNTSESSLKIRDSKFINNSCTGNSGGAISASTSVTGDIYITGCVFNGNTTGTQYGAAIHCANKKASEQVFLGVNNCLFYQNGSVQTNKGAAKADGNSSISVAGLHVIMNSTLIATSNTIIRTGYNGGGEVDHTLYGGSLLLNNIIVNESTNSLHKALNTINSKYCLRCNGYNYFSSKGGQVSVSSEDVEFSLTSYSWNSENYSWSWTPTDDQKQKMAIYTTLYDLVNNDQYNSSNSTVHDKAAKFLKWLKEQKYENNYDAFQVDINGRLRNTAHYWPGCYQNDET